MHACQTSTRAYSKRPTKRLIEKGSSYIPFEEQFRTLEGEGPRTVGQNSNPSWDPPNHTNNQDIIISYTPIYIYTQVFIKRVRTFYEFNFCKYKFCIFIFLDFP